jgi:adenylate cyclase
LAIGRIWLAPLMLVAGAVTYWISRNVTSLIHAPRRREKLARFLPKDLARLLEDSDLDLTLGGKTTRVTVLVADIRGFTRYCENRSPQEIAEALNEYFTFMSAIIHDHGGMIDKYIGDAVMAVFGAPLPREDHASRAAGRPSFRIGIALNTGEALAGYIGAPDRLDYTVIGDTVNLAARREELNKTYGTSVIMSEETCREIGAGAGARFLGEVPIRGRESPVRIYSLDRPA